MFLPPGEIIHESLATSYVLVDALCADLCEGGFSGVVEVVLRDTDSFIVIFNGFVSAVIEERTGSVSDGSDAFTRTTVERLAERSRLERGRVAIYGYPAATANAVAGRINARPLYVGLSTEFTDLEKMIAKLVRERDREWFIEVAVETGLGALIHMSDNECRIISSTGLTDTGALDLASNPALGDLIDVCKRGVGTFDVYFTQAEAEAFSPNGNSTSESVSMSLPVAEDVTLVDEPVSGELPGIDPVSGAEVTKESPVELDHALLRAVTDDDAEGSPENEEYGGDSRSAMTAVAATQFVFAATTETEPPALREDIITSKVEDLAFVRDEIETKTADVEAMTEIKRLMGEIARVIEEAAQSVSRPDSFSMSLRAGQLEIADRYPFLDPFAGEFEYLAGEIVFVGHATAERFVEGLTVALKLAIEAVALSTTYSDRFRTYVTEDLRKLNTRERGEFERFGLENVIQQILPL
jgi:hypothetical protein